MGMNKIDEKVAEIKKRGRIGLMTHVVLGYPTLEDTVKIVKAMARQGVDFIELQIPFSDPLADGPTIMRACEQSLKNGTKVTDAFEIMKSLSSEVNTPLLFMAYYNTVFKYGTEKFCHDAEAAGISGLIVPDMSIDEEQEEHFFACCRRYHLANIQVVSPISSNERLKKNAQLATGFVYCASRLGITGVKDELDPHLLSFLTKARSIFSVPLAVGFGISKREHLQALLSHADIAIVGSAIIDVVSSSKPAEITTNVTRFISSLLS